MSKRNSSKKGNQYEKEVKDILEAWGYTVEGQHRRVGFLSGGKRIMVGRDIFGCDLIAKAPGQMTRWVQVGTIANKSNKQKQQKEFPWNHYELVEAWLRLPNKKVYEVYKGRLNGDGWIEGWMDPVTVDYNEETRRQK